jgi:hypothetical protein
LGKGAISETKWEDRGRVPSAGMGSPFCGWDVGMRKIIHAFVKLSIESDFYMLGFDVVP